MSGDIWFGFDKSSERPSKLNDGYVNSRTFMAFGDLLDAALKEKHAAVLESIKEGEPMAIYDCSRLSATDYNALIAAMRSHIAGMTGELTPWQQTGIWVWREMAEPFIRKDDRYDFAFHNETPPQTLG
jgi:hypothetical protein